MSKAVPQSGSLRERIAGKWQIPALIVSTALLIVVAVNVRSPDRKVPITDHLDYIVRLIDQRMFIPASDLSSRLLRREDLVDGDRAVLTLLLARANFGEAQRTQDDSRSTARSVAQLFHDAVTLGAELTGPDHRTLALTSRRLDQYELAVRHYEQAAELLPAPALDVRRPIIELSEYPLKVEPQRIDSLLDSFIVDAQDAPRDLAWALSRRAERYFDDGDWPQAHELLEAYVERFRGTPFEAEFDYLTALTLWGAKRYDDAELLLRELLNRVTPSDPVYPKAGWLLGKVVLFDGQVQRPEEAVAIFREVISSRADRYYMTASWVGMAEALAYLRRYEQSLDAYRAALEDIGATIGHRLVNPDVIRASLTVVSDRLRREGDLATALEYMRLATQLVSREDLSLYSQYLERLGDLLAATAHERLNEAKEFGPGDDADAARRRLVADAELLLAEAGETYFELSSVSTLNEERAATAMWTAAGLFDEAGNDGRAITVLETYLMHRPQSTLVPRVLLRLGRTLQKVGRYEDAVNAFQRNYSEYPRSIHANESLIPLAESLMALGGDHELQAEKALLEVVQDSDIYTPDAPEYRDAMFLLGRYYSRRAEHERTIAVLDEFVQRYATDSRIDSAMFLIADAYRQSAQVIKDELLDPRFAGEAKRLIAEREQRLNEAAARFRAVIQRLELRSAATLSPLEQIYLQDAVLGEAASLFDLGRYAEALNLYERAAWTYKDQPAALGAYVQIINCFVILGRDAEARAALRRAQYLTEAITDESFDPAGDLETRADWKRYFDWVADVLRAGAELEPAMGSTS